MHLYTVVELESMIWTTTAVGVVLAIGRFMIHYHTRQRICWDDILNGVAVTFLLAYTGTWQVYGPYQYQQQLFGLGLSSYEPPMMDSKKRTNYNIANTLMFWCTVYAVKASFLALYWNIFKVSNGFKLAWWLATTYTVLAFLITFLWSFWICGSPKDFLNDDVCAEADPSISIKMFIAWCVLDVVGDFILMFLPTIMLKRMHMSTQKTLGVAICFGLVIINVVFEILRTVNTLSEDREKFPDGNVSWCFLQISTAVIICALPCYGGLFSRKKKSGTPILITVHSESSGSPIHSWTSSKEGSDYAMPMPA